MRHRFSLGWLGTSLLCFWLLSGAAAVFSGGELLENPLAAAEEGKVLDDELPPTADTGEGDTGESLPQKQNYLVWMYQSLRLFYSIVFLSLSFTLVALFVMNLLAARRENVVPVALVEGFEAHLNEKRYQEAYEMAKSDESFLGQVLSAGLAKLSAGYDQAIEAMQEVGEDENMKLEHRLSYMALIGTISPMIGLLGTVQGMISAFSEIAIRGATPKAQDLAEGISTALFTTLVGLFIAIPAIAAYNILRNRVQRLVLEVGILSEGLMSRFSTVGPGGGAGGAKRR
jgi:biopolymer transport protein ExbB